jgi:hypothetical protein
MMELLGKDERGGEGRRRKKIKEERCSYDEHDHGLGSPAESGPQKEDSTCEHPNPFIGT